MIIDPPFLPNISESNNEISNIVNNNNFNKILLCLMPEGFACQLGVSLGA